MKKLKSYIVGGHRFCVAMSEKSVLWNGMCNYVPFIVGECDIDNLDSVNEVFPDSVFCLDIDVMSNGRDIIEGAKTIAEFDDDTAYISVMYGNKGERIFLISINGSMKNNGGVLVIGDDTRQCKLYVGACNKDNHGIFVINNAIMLLYAFCTASRNTLLIHASVVSSGGYGYAFLGKSGTGKSTHTRLWLQNISGTSLLNDDNPVVRIEDNDDVMIYGSPWSGKTPCYINGRANLKAIVRLSQAPHNFIRRLSGVSAYAALAPSASSMKWERNIADGLHDTLSKLVSLIGIYHLECLPNADAAYVCYETVK